MQAGPRWGPRRVGLSKDAEGVLTAEPETQARLDAIMADIGEPPSGFGIAFPVRNVKRTRNLAYKADSRFCLKDENGASMEHAVLWAATGSGTRLCDVSCNKCGVGYKLVEE